MYLSSASLYDRARSVRRCASWTAVSTIRSRMAQSAMSALVAEGKSLPCVRCEVAADLATVLDLGNPRSSLALLDDE